MLELGARLDTLQEERAVRAAEAHDHDLVVLQNVRPAQLLVVLDGVVAGVCASHNLQRVVALVGPLEAPPDLAVARTVLEGVVNLLGTTLIKCIFSAWASTTSLVWTICIVWYRGSYGTPGMAPGTIVIEQSLKHTISRTKAPNPDLPDVNRQTYDQGPNHLTFDVSQ